MPRDASGNYTLASPAFVPGTVISSSSVNSDLSDIATALTQSLATTGVSSMTGPIKATDGSVGAPGYTFSAETGTGMYRSSGGTISFAGAGANLLTISSTAFTFNNQSITTTGAVTTGNLTVNGTASITGNTTISGSLTLTGGISPNAVRTPNTTSYTIVAADNQRVINSFNAGGTLTITVPNTLSSGTTFTLSRITNNIIVNAPSGGNIILPTGVSISSLTMSQNEQTLNFTFDSTNLLVTGGISPTLTVQVLTSGSGATYTPTLGTLKIRVRMAGGGGGGGAQTTNNGNNGNNTSFGSWVANGGSAGLANGANGAAGGAGGTGGANGTGTLVFRLPGGSGQANWTSGSGVLSGGIGGDNPFMGGGRNGSPTSAGQSATGNTGCGGQGGGSSGGLVSGTGGGAGEYVEFWVTNPGATTYTIGTGGNGGAAGTLAGGNGGSGVIIIEEFYS